MARGMLSSPSIDSGVLGRQFAENREIGTIHGDQYGGVNQGQRALHRDRRDVEQRNQQPHHFDGVVIPQADLAERRFRFDGDVKSRR